MKNPIIRTIYLYLFALVGLAMLIIGCAMILNLGLKTFIFTKADEVEDYYNRPAPLYLNSEIKTVQDLQICGSKCNLTEMQKEQIDNWLVDYETWQSDEKNKDKDFYMIRNRQRDASTALSLIFVGLPLWLFHWAIIKKDLRKKD
jgi:hypothetical protein